MHDPDLFRDTWVRYLGYANEVGESFRPIVPVQVVRASYTVAFAYVIADTLDKSVKMLKVDARPHKVAIAASDALIWQTLASVIIPGFAINRLCAGTQQVLKLKAPRMPVTMRNWTTVGVGLLCIPFIIYPIDHGVTFLMDQTIRKWVK